MTSTIPITRLNNHPTMQRLERTFTVPDNFGGNLKSQFHFRSTKRRN